MLAKITAYNGTIYRFATSTQDTADGIYTGRIVEEIDFTSQSSDNGAAPNTINITIRNDDNFIPKNVDLWGATIDLTATNGKSWRGKITFFSFDADGNVYITATEKSLPELELQMPDEVRQVYTIDDNFHQSSQTVTIPLVIGGTHSSPISLPTILIDKQNGIYLICTGEIREIVAVYNGSEALPRSAYIPYRGWSTQAEHPGFAYVQIEEPYRTNADGSYAEINVDVVGLKLGNHTEAECRNGARFLYYFLTTPATGVNGWGLGIDPSEIDTASFNTAITLCDASGFKLDGIMWLRQGADAWINQICQAIHGKYSININGKRTLTIDYAGAASKANFGPNDMRISRYGKNAYTGAIYNKGVFSYGYNPITGLFMQSAQYENSESVAQIGEQKFVGESYLINDAATALAVLEYTCKKSQIAAESIEFETDRLDTLLYAGDLITISRSDISISGTFQIKSISTSESKSVISASRFDSSVFVVGGTHTNINWNSEKPITPALTPAEATNLLLTTGFDINPDGTGTPYIKGTFTPPAGGWLAAAVQFSEAESLSDWTELSLITEGRFKISPVKAGQIYSVRVRMITATGHSDYITGQIRAEGDTVAPGIPNIVASTYLKTIRINITLPNPPSDLAGFEIYRSNISGEHGSKIGYISAVKGEGTYIDTTAANYLTNFYYSAKSIDKWGNASGHSSQAVANCSKIQAHEVEADWVISNLMETARGVGADVNGIKIDSSGIEGWNGGERYIDFNSDGGSTIAGWNIGTNSLYNNNIELVSSGVARTMDFVSGHKGWQIDSNGKAEFQDATIRGTMTSVNFVKDTVSAVGGSLMILGAAEVQSFTKTTQNYQTILTEDCLDLATENGDVIISEQSGTSVYYAITLDDTSTFNGGDILRIRNAETVQDLWLGVVSKASNIINCVMLYGTAIELESGMCVVNYRRAGNGGINLNGNNPSIDLYNHNGRPWAGTNLLARIGNLNGVNGITDDRYGFFFGNSDRSVTGRHYITWNETSNELEISGKLKAATGSFSGRVEAESGIIGKFEMTNGILTYTKNNLDFNDGNLIIQNPNAILEGTNIGSIRSMMTLGGIKTEADLSNINRGVYEIKSGLNLDSSDTHYGNVETAYSKISNNQLTKGVCRIGYSYIGLTSYERSSAGGSWSLGSAMNIGVNSIISTYAGSGLNRTLNISPLNGFSITDNQSNRYSKLDFNRLIIGSIVDFDTSNNNLVSVLEKVHSVSILGNGGGKSISMSLDSSYSSAVAAINVAVPSDSYVGIGTNGRISAASVTASGLITSRNGTCSGSAEESKTNIEDVDVLDSLKTLRVKRWNYKDDLNTSHVGPMAKDFNEMFAVNRKSGENINYTDSIGVALRAIQELAARLDSLTEEITRLKGGAYAGMDY